MIFKEEKKSFFGKMSQRISDALAGKAVIDKQPKLEGRSMMMFMSPVPNK